MPSATIFTKEKKTTLRDKALAQVRQAILSGKLKPGNRLIEQELSEEMGISRLPIREAIASLEHEGLVTIEPYKKTVVTKLSPKEIDEIYSIRELLELHALQLLMRDDASAAVARLEEVIRCMEEGWADAGSDFVGNDFAFHESLCQMTGNSMLHKLWLMLSTKILVYINIEAKRSSLPLMVENHRKLCRLIAAGDLAAASEALKKHLRSGRDRVLGLA